MGFIFKARSVLFFHLSNKCAGHKELPRRKPQIEGPLKFLFMVQQYDYKILYFKRRSGDVYTSFAVGAKRLSKRKSFLSPT